MEIVMEVRVEISIEYIGMKIGDMWGVYVKIMYRNMIYR